MAAGLLTGYGGAGVMAARYLYPATGQRRGWLFACQVTSLAMGDSMVFESPIGEKVTIARSGVGESAEDFVALSSTCPHLGCQVHWQQPKERFFCPCHNGAFDASGKATEGPPADAGTDLPTYPLRVEGAMLFIEVPLESVNSGGRRA